MLREMIQRICGRIAIVALTMTGAGSVNAEVKPLGAWYRADTDFPAFTAFWGGDSNEEEIAADRSAPTQGSSVLLGGSVHVYMQNTGRRPVEVRDVLLEGESLRASLVFSDQRVNRKPASIYFAGLGEAALKKLIDAGEPVWWKADPVPIPPGGVSQVVVRLRRSPTGGQLRLTLLHGEKGRQELTVPVAASHPRVAGFGLADKRDKAVVYFTHPEGGGHAPDRILFDGEDVTPQSRILRDGNVSVAPAVVRLSEAWKPGSFHVVQGVYADGITACALVRAWADQFAYGIFGGLPGKGSDVEVARQYLADIASHLINVQMPQLGSAAVQQYLKTPAGQRRMRELGLDTIIDEPGKWGVRNPYLFWIHDEPDCGDYRMTGIPEDRKVGALAQWCTQRADELNAADSSVLRMLNLDMTYKPYNWYNYGQVPDILAVDPYYQARLRTAYWKKPEQIPLYSDATYVHACASVCQSACEPNPLHVILYACSYVDGADDRRFRWPTPVEKRIEAYYALAAGAKGLSYWWYTPSCSPREKGGSACGVGAALRDGDPDAERLWTEIALMGAEIRTAGGLLSMSCPTAMPIEASDGLWVRSLLVGEHAAILLVVNDRYTNTDTGTLIETVNGARITVTPPAWLARPDVFEITPNGIRNVRARASSDTVAIDLGDVEVTRLLVITGDAGLTARLDRLYQDEYAERVQRLRARAP